MSLLAGVVVTGTEVLTGLTTDRNGPWLSQRLADLGAEVCGFVIVGDRPADLERALSDLARAGAGLICTSGGLGPTEDDLTAQVVADWQRRPMHLDTGLEERIWRVIAPLRERWPDIPEETLRRSNRKQALVPEGAGVLEPVGTAPGLVVPPPDDEPGGPTVVVLPGPPRELQKMWPAAADHPMLRAALGELEQPRVTMLRLFGMPESEIAETMRLAREDGIGIDSLEISTCMRRGEIEVVTRAPAAADGDHDRWIGFVRGRHGAVLFSDDFSLIDDLVPRGLEANGWTIATAESCTGGLLAGRLTERPGSSGYVRGGLVVYDNEAKTSLAGVDAALIDAHGAVSAEVAVALADGARSALGTDVGVGVTGIAGPGGGSDEKPVGTVCISVAAPDGARLTRRVRLPGSRSEVRDRTTTVAMHLTHRLLNGERDDTAS